MVAGTLASFFRFGFYDREQADPDALGFGGWHDEIALETSRRGMVLLRNEGDFLPLDPAQTKRIVLIGANARETETSGFGAARVEPTNPVSILASFKRAMGDGVEVLHFDEVSPAARRAMETADASFVSVFTREREANDRPFALPAEQQELITAAAEVTDRLGVLVTAGSGIEMAPWIEDTRAVLMAWFGGNVGNTAVGEIIAGQTNPEGKLPFSIEKRWEDSAAYGRFLPHDATFNDVPIWNRERPVFPVVYDEGLLSGYRHFDAHGIEPQFAFGHGLSFTTFGFDGLEVELPGSAADPLAVVRVRVTNTGDREGAEVAQLYVGGIGDGADRPVRMLKGFEKVRLAPGESRVVEFGLSARDLSYFDPDQGKWRMDEGDVTVHVGASSRDLPLSARFGMPDDG
jgi:beta-glucosidase